MGYEHLAISLHSRSGAQHWQRAALVIAILSGFLTGLFIYASLFNRLTVPLATDPAIIGVSLHAKDIQTQITQELLGYLQETSSVGVTGNTNNPFLADIHVGILTPVTKKTPTVTLVSLWPKSYISYKNTLLPLRMRDYGLEISTRRQRHLGTPLITKNMSFIHMKHVTLPGLFSNLTVSKLEFNKDRVLIVSGESEESGFIELLSALNRPILTKETTLEDGTSIIELRAASHTPTIEINGNISTYSSTQPFFLATQNKDSGFWALRNIPTTASAAESSPLAPSTCPHGSLGEIQKDDSSMFTQYKFVNNILDKVTLTKSMAHLCITVDKL